VIAWELDILGSHGMASVDYPGMLELVEAGTLRPQELVEQVVGLAEGARLLPSVDTASPVGVTLIDPRLQ
jgi:alcohol dehydrogenase